jgi:AAA15 family ATPase/GTPase
VAAIDGQHLHRVRLFNVYSFQEAQLTCTRSVTAIIGANDVGKSNILRAINNFTVELTRKDISPRGTR